jgi:hypothetical protein
VGSVAIAFQSSIASRRKQIMKPAGRMVDGGHSTTPGGWRRRGPQRSEDTRRQPAEPALDGVGKFVTRPDPCCLFLVVAGTGAGLIGQGLGMQPSATYQAPLGDSSQATEPTGRF